MEKIKKNKTKLILILIIAIQLLIYVGVGIQKSYIHIDEGYSLGLLHYDKLDISENEDFYNNWHNDKYYNDYLTIGKEEINNFKPVYENQKNDVHPPLYYLLLKIAYNMHPEKYSKWPGLILNMIFITISTILIYKICKIIFKDEKYALIMTIGAGLILSTIESCMLMRMYALNALNILAITYIHLKIWNQNKIKIKDLIIIGILAILGSLTHYYYLVFLFGLYVTFMIKYISKKQYKNAISYTLTFVIAAIISLAIFPYSFVHIFMGYRGQGAFANISQSQKIINGMGGYLNLINQDIFNGTLIIILAIILVSFIYKLAKNKKMTIEVKNEKILIALIPTILYFTLIAVVSPYIEIRYIMPICPLIYILIMYFIKTFIEKTIKKEKNAKILTIILTAIILIFPIITNRNVTYVYNDLNEIVSKLENEYNLPTIYLFNKEQNRFMDDIYLFSKIKESYILDSKDMSEEKIKEILKDKDINKGIIIFINGGQENDKELEKITKATNLTNIEYLKRMNACDIYYIHK